MEITGTMVWKLKELTGAGLMDCKKALYYADGDIEEAIKYLKNNPTTTSI